MEPEPSNLKTPSNISYVVLALSPTPLILLAELFARHSNDIRAMILFFGVSAFVYNPFVSIVAGLKLIRIRSDSRAKRITAGVALGVGFTAVNLLVGVPLGCACQSIPRNYSL